VTIKQKIPNSDFFSRNIGSITEDQQIRLQESVVTVVGCGGLGGYVIEQLARLGIGTLKICDPDRFSESNCNRQLHALPGTTGRHKAMVTAEYLHNLHDRINVLAINTNFQDAEEQLFTDTGVVVDCLDSIYSRCELAALCQQYRLPLVHGAVQQWYGQAGVQLAGGTLIRDIYGCPEVVEPEPPSVLSFTVAIIAGIQAAETCKLLLGMDSPLQNNWLSMDLRRMTFDLAG
jgi:molybdopterin/thiamine biosynthesis adenylyltransferase